MKLLLAKGADIEDGSIIEASKFGHANCLRYMFEHGADINEGGLHVAAERGQWGVVQLYLDVGADLYQCSSEMMVSRKSRAYGLERKKHSVLPHLIHAPNKNADYKAVMQKLVERFEKPDPRLLVDAVRYLDDDLTKWILAILLLKKSISTILSSQLPVGRTKNPGVDFYKRISSRG